MLLVTAHEYNTPLSNRTKKLINQPTVDQTYQTTNQTTNQLHGAVLPEKLTVPKLIKIYTAFCGMKLTKLENYQLLADHKSYSVLLSEGHLYL
jgi:hypothetical protein